MATLKELNVKKGDKLKAKGIESFFVKSFGRWDVCGHAKYSNGIVANNICFSLNGLPDWERIEESPEAVEEPPQSTYAYLAAQHGIVIIADGVTYDGTKQ